MNKSKLFFCIVMLVSTLSIYGQLVTTNSELDTAISNATAGTTIILADQTWTDVQIDINKTGISGNPITIQAETPGSVFIEGNSYIKMGGEYIVFEGVVFQNASASISPSTPLIDFRASSTNCNNCKVTNVKINAFNQSTANQTSVFKWILLRGANNEVSYCSFLGKHGVGSIINDNRSDAIPNYHKIHHNYFADRTPQGTSGVNDDNDQDAIRIGSSSTSLSDSFTEVYDNYFYNFSGEVEVISNKSGSNKYYNNTFEDYQGALTLRHGDNCEVYNNFFFADNNPFTGGIRVIGENHKIYNNYIEGINSRKADNSLSSATGGINIANGRTDGVLSGYFPVKNTTIVNNTFVNCDYGLRIGTAFSGTQSVAPDNVIIGNNIMYINTDKAIQVTTQLTGASSKYENNIKQTGTFDSFGSVAATGNINVTSGLLASGTEFYRIITGSTAIDYGLGTYTFLTTDITGGTRPANFDAGAEELGSGGTKLPYSQSDVGVTVGFGAETLSISEHSIDKKLTIYPNPVEGNYLNISLRNENIGLVAVIDMLGRTIQKNYFNLPNGKIDVTHLKKGMYFLKVRNISKKIIIQ